MSTAPQRGQRRGRSLELGFHFGLMDTDPPSLTRWLEERFADVAPEDPAASPR
ncbi:hypothetical protein WMF30_16040 [Sorangium sp. So ce134]